jgi:hypothetical protein
VAHRRRTRLACEELEGRTVPSNFTAATVSDLIADINAANTAGGSNTIALVAGKTFTLTTAMSNNSSGVAGYNGLPVILANDNLTIQGNGDMILRSATAPAFRLLAVAPGAALTLENLTLKGGLAGAGSYDIGPGPDTGAAGGAIYSAGALTLSGVTVTGNSAVGWVYLGGDYGGWGQPGEGGGIYSEGSLALEAGTVITNNSAVGFNNGIGRGGGVYVAGIASLTGVTLSYNTAKGGDYGQAGGWGGSGEGGALFVTYGGTTATAVTLSNDILSFNTAVGGKGKSNGGEGQGGAVYVMGYAAVTMTSDTLSSNSAVGGGGSTPGEALGGAVYVGDYSTHLVTLRDCAISGNSAQTSKSSKSLAEGGGIYIASTAIVYLDAFTLANTINNKDSSGTDGSTANIDGSYTLIT